MRPSVFIKRTVLNPSFATISTHATNMRFDRYFQIFTNRVILPGNSPRSKIFLPLYLREIIKFIVLIGTKQVNEIITTDSQSG